jgi:hypothetical protein
MKSKVAIDGKTRCGGSDKQKANHIVVGVVDENGFCLGQE